MGYIIDIEKELHELLENMRPEDRPPVITFVKEKVLESYKNGIMSAKLVKADKDADRKAKSFVRGK